MSKIMGLPNQRWRHESPIYGKWVEGVSDELQLWYTIITTAERKHFWTWMQKKRQPQLIGENIATVYVVQYMEVITDAKGNLKAQM